MASKKLECHFSGKNLDKKDTFGKSDPYLVISKLTDDEGGIMEICRTDVIKKTLDPKWEPVCVVFESGRGADVQVKISCYDYDVAKQDDLIGEFYTSLFEMIKAETSRLEWNLINPKKFQEIVNYKNSGVIVLSQVNVLQ